MSDAAKRRGVQTPDSPPVTHITVVVIGVLVVVGMPVVIPRVLVGMHRYVIPLVAEALRKEACVYAGGGDNVKRTDT